VTNRGDALALAVALSVGEEVTLGPSDSALCAEALKFYASAKRRERLMKLMRLPAIIAAAMIGLMAGGSLTPVLSRASGKVAMIDLRAVPLHHTSRFAAAPVRAVLLLT
jgi:hypothetical protein